MDYKSIIRRCCVRVGHDIDTNQTLPNMSDTHPKASGMDDYKEQKLMRTICSWVFSRMARLNLLYLPLSHQKETPEQEQLSIYNKGTV